jgi:hypothetical protein
LVTETYEYEAPFKYPNVTVVRLTCMGRESHGVELDMANKVKDAAHPEAYDVEGDHIIVVEDHPMVRVAVIGSACTPPGYVQIECEPTPEWTNRYERPGCLPPRFRIGNLWGMHLRVDATDAHEGRVKPGFSRVDGSDYPDAPDAMYELFKSLRGRLFMKSHYRENPLAGMSCAVFEIPPSKKVIIQGGSETPGWTSDNFPGDGHYSFRTIRTTVLIRREEA